MGLAVLAILAVLETELSAASPTQNKNGAGTLRSLRRR
jgi:hypothetical protein